jgi:hypothetical protein
MKSNFIIAIICAALFGGLTGAKLALKSRHAPRAHVITRA